jgi:hypothetical protein
MTKKQLKQLAKRIAKLETIIQTSNDEYAVRQAKEQMLQINESSELELDDMVRLDEMVLEELQGKI